MTSRRVDLRASRRAGIDAYHGRFTSGAFFAIDFSDPDYSFAETIGIVDGNFSSWDQGRPLRGDLEVDPSKVAALTDLLREHLQAIKEAKRTD